MNNNDVDPRIAEITNPKYGEYIRATLIADDSDYPYIIGIIKYNDVSYLQIRRMYWSDDKLGYGKSGTRIPIEGDIAEDAISAATTMLMAYMDMDE